MECDKAPSRIEVKLTYYSGKFQHIQQSSLKSYQDYLSEANKFLENGRIQEALSTLQKALKGESKTQNILKQGLAKRYYEFGLLFGKHNLIQLANKYLNKSLELYDKYNSTGEHFRYDIYFALGNNHFHAGKFDDASKYYEKALEFKLKENNGTYSHLQEIYTNIGIIYYKQKNYRKAIEKFEKALEIAQDYKSKEDLSIGILYGLLGNCLMNIQGKDLEALGMLNKGIQILSQKPEQNKESLMIDLFSHFMIVQNFRNSPEAIRILKKALQISRLSKSHFASSLNLHLETLESRKAELEDPEFV